jgi:hypothetical protein
MASSDVSDTTAARLPRKVALVGDSQAHSLAVNLPDGLSSTFSIVNGALEGCSVHASGRVLSSMAGFRNDFSPCAGWVGKWASVAGSADVMLVVLGAWDVFDLDIDGVGYSFGTTAWNQRFTTSLLTGIDAAVSAGSHVALLEVACMRPQASSGAAVPALPERAEDKRVAHLNGLLRRVAAERVGRVSFIEGPRAWCDDPAIASDLSYRWDGVHVYRPGAKLIYEAIAAALLALPVRSS